MYELKPLRCPACLFTVIMFYSDSTTVKSTGIFGFAAVLDCAEKDGGASFRLISNALLKQT
jgi:hypothetical protein